MEPVYWRLEYADGRVLDEPDEGGSIRDSPPLPVRLLLTRPPERQPFVQVPLLDRMPGHGPWRPIFYRQRNISLDGSAAPTLVVIVFGRGCEGPERNEAQVWALDTFGNTIDCPDWALDLVAINLLVGRNSNWV
jgi:hypothetical protein